MADSPVYTRPILSGHTCKIMVASLYNLKGDKNGNGKIIKRITNR